MHNLWLVTELICRKVYKLTDNTTVEKQEIIALLSQFGRPDNLSDIYPDLCMYLEKYCFHGDTLSKELTEYFEDYKQQKIRNSMKYKQYHLQM